MKNAAEDMAEKHLLLCIYFALSILLPCLYLHDKFTSPTTITCFSLSAAFILLAAYIHKEKIDYSKDLKIVHDRYLRYMHYLTLLFISGLLVPYIVIQGNRKIKELEDYPAKFPDFGSLWIFSFVILAGIFLVFSYMHSKLKDIEAHIPPKSNT